jgi:pimeloyl-ACP methyl ester carboxylesterase
MTTSPSFTTGYHDFHPDLSINYQLNRFSDNSPASVAELTAAGPRIGDYADYIRELLTLSDIADAGGRALAGALYQRSAEFYMLPDDPRKPGSRHRFITSMCSIFDVDPAARERVPYLNGHLGAYRSTPPAAVGTMLLFGGFDSYMEELFASQAYLVAAGYEVILFEGPGQGSVLEEDHLVMTPDWAPVVAAVIDHYRLSDITLIGYSLGGGLAVRAAAREPRVRRVICDDIFTDFFECTLGQVRPAARRVLGALVTIGGRSAVNRLAARAMRESPVAEWGLRQGMHTTGASAPYDFLRSTRLYETASVSSLVTQDVLLLAGSADHYVPRSQLPDQLASLTAARSVTARVFTTAENAQNHVHIGNTELSLQVMIAWMKGLDDRDLGQSAGH